MLTGPMRGVGSSGIETPDRPTGTVTFLFTDIEGSTRLLERLRGRYDDVLSRHARLVRGASEEFGGHEVDTQGDAFFVVFARARDAVGAAVAAQRALAAESWPDGVTVRVRMGIHTGEPIVGGERYVGMDVHRGARICAAGHGGQVLLSNTTRELVEDDLPDDVHVVDLGEHELKDLKRPERIFQLEIAGLPSSFPALRTAQASAFEGREGELARAAERVGWRRLRSRRVAVVAALGVVVVAAAGAGLLALAGSSTTAVAPNSVVALSPSGSISAVVPVGAQPAAIASGAGALWVANLDDQSVTRVDPNARQAVRAIPVGTPVGLAASKTAVWLTNGSGALSKIDPTYDHLSPVWSPSTGSFNAGPTTVRPTLAAFGSIWVVDPEGYVLRLDPASGRVVASVGVGNDPSAIASGAGSVWVANSSDGTVTRIDPATLDTTTVPVGHGPAAIAVNASGAWVANAGDDAVVRVDPGTNAVAVTKQVGNGPDAVLATPTAIWVANAGDGTVMRLDPLSGDVTKTIRVGGTPTAFASAAGRAWVTVAPPLPPPPATGGVARAFVGSESVASLDPALDTAPQILYATCANLVTYPDEPAPEGSQIVPDVAQAVPTPTAGGTTYTFRIRPGFRFSPPSNEPVTAATFKATIERVADPHLQSLEQQPLPYFSDVVGYKRYVTGKTQGLAGVVARGTTLTIRLSHPDGAFLSHLAASAACAVPPNTPAEPLDDIPSAGPYYIASYTPRQQLILRRNPNYHGSRPHRLDAIVYAIGVDLSRAIAEIEAGKADYTEGVPVQTTPTLAAEYGAGSKAALAGHQQYFVNLANGARYLHLNASRPLFASARVRRAVSYAVDRQALAAQGRRFPVAGFSGGPATSDYLIPSIAGARDFHLYPLRADLTGAKRLAGHLHATAILYAATVPPWPQEAQIIRRDLRPLGIDVQI